MLSFAAAAAAAITLKELQTRVGYGLIQCPTGWAWGLARTWIWTLSCTLRTGSDSVIIWIQLQVLIFVCVF